MSELQQKPFQKRQVAYKVRISDIVNGSFTKDEFSAGYIRLNDVNVSRVNVFATVVYVSENVSTYASAVIDDGTGKILVRGFGNVTLFSKVNVGDIVLIIGKIREFNGERYIVPEIFKKIENVEWMNVRKIELRGSATINHDTKTGGRYLSEEIIDIEEEIYSLIKKLDNSDGASIDDVIKNSNNSNVEDIIKKLLEEGNIFEIKPGKLKVLE